MSIHFIIAIQYFVFNFYDLRQNLKDPPLKLFIRVYSIRRT